MKNLVIEEYEYKGYTLQRLTNCLWYAVKDNIICDIDQYQNDIKERIDIHLNQLKDENSKEIQ